MTDVNMTMIQVCPVIYVTVVRLRALYYMSVCISEGNRQNDEGLSLWEEVWIEITPGG